MPVLTEAAFQVWQGRSCFAGVHAKAGVLGGVDPPGNAEAWQVLLAQYMETVRTGSFKCLMSWAEGKQEKWCPPAPPPLEKAPTERASHLWHLSQT